MMSHRFLNDPRAIRISRMAQLVERRKPISGFDDHCRSHEVAKFRVLCSGHADCANGVRVRKQEYNQNKDCERLPLANQNTLLVSNCHQALSMSYCDAGSHSEAS